MPSRVEGVKLAQMSLTRIWHNQEPFHVEFAEISLEDGALQARGVAIGVEPVAYRLEYALTTTAGYVTQRLEVTSGGAGWRRSLVLERSASGEWACTTEAEGPLDLPNPGGDLSPVAGALDCDLGFSPLTNSMPLLRHDLHRQPGSVDFLMAWVGVPELAVYPSRQRYTFLRHTAIANAVVRFDGLDSDFTAEITFDEHGLVLDYPGIGRAVTTAIRP
jgi:uncharacterized protein